MDMYLEMDANPDKVAVVHVNVSCFPSSKTEIDLQSTVSNGPSREVSSARIGFNFAETRTDKDGSNAWVPLSLV
jgi:hypothetical protein